jgi:hypothetical protein
VSRPTCERVGELLQRFIDATYLGERVGDDVLDQAQAAVHELLAPITPAELAEVAALGSCVGTGLLKELGARNARRN